MESNENTKEQILKISLNLFAEKGYEAIGVQEICLKTEITKPTLYYYFGSKAGLLQSIVEIYGKLFCDKLQEATIYEHDFQKSLTKILQTVIKFAKDYKDFFTFHCVLLNAPDNSESKNIYAPVIKEIESILLKFFKNSTNEFGNMKGKEKLYTILFYNNLISIGRETIHGNIKSGEDTIYQIVHSFLYGIAN